MKNLNIAFPKATLAHQHESPVRSKESDESGLLLESPHKSLVGEKEFPCNIPGVGDVSTAWIGHHGLKEIQSKIKESKAQSKEREMSIQLRVLAEECLKAFEVSGLSGNNHQQVKKAMELCSSYAPKATKKATKTSSSIASLWKQSVETDVSQNETPLSLATSILGEQLVAEESRTPPDVSLNSYVGFIFLDP